MKTAIEWFSYTTMIPIFIWKIPGSDPSLEITFLIGLSYRDCMSELF
jgi:hypothetical protein